AVRDGQRACGVAAHDRDAVPGTEATGGELGGDGAGHGGEAADRPGPAAPAQQDPGRVGALGAPQVVQRPGACGLRHGCLSLGVGARPLTAIRTASSPWCWATSSALESPSDWNHSALYSQMLRTANARTMASGASNSPDAVPAATMSRT